MSRNLRGLAVAFVGAVACSGCAHTHDVTVGPSSLSYLNARVGHRAATVVLRNGASFRASNLHLGPDSTVWRTPGNDAAHAAATADVAEVAIRNHPRGALDGILIAFAMGAPVGAALIDNPNGPVADAANRAEAAAAGGVAFAIWGGPIGLIVGSRTRYRLRYRLRKCSCNPNNLIDRQR